jgi:hypothetical protein
MSEYLEELTTSELKYLIDALQAKGVSADPEEPVVCARCPDGPEEIYAMSIIPVPRPNGLGNLCPLLPDRPGCHRNDKLNRLDLGDEKNKKTPPQRRALVTGVSFWGQKKDRDSGGWSF